MKHYLLFITAVLFATSSYAQSLGVTSYNATTPYSQEYRKVIHTSDGNFIAVSSSGLKGRVCKMNAGFIPLWSMEVDSIPFNDVAETNDGNYVIQAYSYRTDFPAGGVYVLKLTPTGTVVFQKNYHDPNGSAAITASGIVKAAGTDNGFVLFGGNCLMMQYMLKCDASGTIQWQKTYIAAFGSGAIFSAITETNGYTVALSTSQNGIPSVGILKVDALGTPVAARTMQSTNGQILYYNCLVKLNSGDYFLWAAPYDIYGAQNYTISNSLSAITCNRISNTSFEATGVFATGNANDDVMLTFIGYNTYYSGFVKLAPSGTIVLQKHSTDLTNRLQCMHGLSLNNGTYLMNGNINANRGMLAVVDESGAGYCSSGNPGCIAQQNYAFTPGSPTVTPNTTNVVASALNYIPTTITYTTSNICGNLIGVEENNAEAGLSVYPNPFSNSVTIERTTAGEVTVNVFDAMGRLVMSKQTSGTKIEIETAALANGIYSLQLIDATGTKTFRVAKNN